ncbi:invasion and intracellular persistence protein IipA [Mycobacteroides abscessus subsp. abscessus]|uniref:NlpC/P60 family protein n=1 Tax=Mycobacteroides abscessus TaxID=36809 RepID=UPI000927E6B5|nr:NlpC/P60 family protein [Mycobacteroides abscessus]SHU45363.1 invasion and intracellular persistence protein IipA [Mycobacteroides abscessus subsp. abscessus]SHZ14689.1 invasion and intracellular persistence protein IipA [Mycobacteroides abscessus subsp. abscessus]SKP32313.1 invasion and intracellular persistence protein IipA [Mycobacteroides abscessus subsp. abscessus]
MAKIGDIRHWKAEVLEKLFDTAAARAASLHRLGEGMEQVANDLSTWGGVTAGAWKDSAGKTRVDLGDKADAAEKVAKAVKPAIDDVREVTSKLGMLDQDAQAIGATITDDGKVVATRQVKDTDKHLQNDQIARLQQQVTALEQRATQVEQEIAAALRADVTDAPAPVPQGPPVALNASAPVGGPDGNPPYPNGAKPTMIEGAKTIAMADNPPGYDPNMGPGPARDQAWKDYLAGKEANGTQRAMGQPPLALPKPEAVSDKGLRSIGAAGRQQGVSYAWGGNHDVDGPSPGHKATHAEYPGYSQAQLEADGSWTYNDDQRIGFDCGGLVRYSVGQGAGLDVGQGTYAIDTNGTLDQVKGAIPSTAVDQYAKPGDVLIFGGPGGFSGASTTHTGIYVGNGYMMNAPESGAPVRIDVVQGHGTTDVLRIPGQ